MNMKLLTKKEQLDIAKESSSLNELRLLQSSRYMNVRRAVARNENIDKDIANNLLFDPVLNVSYMAFNNPKCTLHRNFHKSNLVHCVLCENDERYLDCSICENRGKSLLNT